jgi:signal transduction histidine kinase
MPEHDPRDRAVGATSPGVISGVAHELRTPIAAIRAAAAALRRGELDREAAERLLGVIEDSAGQLSRLVDDLLSAGRLEAGRLPVDVRPCDVAAVARVVVETARVAGQADVELRVGDTEDALAVADPQRLREALASLVDNAVRHSPAGAAVEVEVEATAGRVAVAVADSGPGIPESDLERIFEPFVRLDEGSAGTGLGLYLARGLARAMGGDLTVDSEPGRGSTFRIELVRVDARDDAE